MIIEKIRWNYVSVNILSRIKGIIRFSVLNSKYKKSVNGI